MLNVVVIRHCVNQDDEGTLQHNRGDVFNLFSSPTPSITNHLVRVSTSVKFTSNNFVNPHG